MKILSSKSLLAMTTVLLLASCMRSRTGLDYELTSQQRKNGVIREIQCATAHSVYAWSVAEVGVSSEVIGKPLEASARATFLTPLVEENYLEVCDNAAEKSVTKAEALIVKLKGNKETHTIKEESIYPEETEEAKDVRWPKDKRYDKVFREGACRCKDRRVEKLKRSVYCTQEYAFKLQGSSEAQKCYGYFTKALPNLPQKELVAVTQREFCQKNTTAWLQECQKNQEAYKQSTYYAAKGFVPEKCAVEHDGLFNPCECSTDVMNLIPNQTRFYCTRSLGDEEIILDLESTSGN